MVLIFSLSVCLRDLCVSAFRFYRNPYGTLYRSNPGDVIKVGGKPSSQQLVLRMTDLTQAMAIVDWLSVDKDKLEATVSRVPERADIDPLVNEQLIVELYSR